MNEPHEPDNNKNNKDPNNYRKDEIQELNKELQELNGNKKAIDLKSREWTHFIRQIALEKSFKRLSTLKPGIFTAYQY
jgi:hypothetical protein